MRQVVTDAGSQGTLMRARGSWMVAFTYAVAKASGVSRYILRGNWSASRIIASRPRGTGFH